MTAPDLTPAQKEDARIGRLEDRVRDLEFLVRDLQLQLAEGRSGRNKASDKQPKRPSRANPRAEPLGVSA